MKDQVTNVGEKGIKSTFLGSAQLDKSIENVALNPSSEYRIIYVTPEWLEKSDKMLKVKNLSQHDMLSLIAIDEAHLFHQRQQFRTAYRLLD